MKVKAKILKDTEWRKITDIFSDKRKSFIKITILKISVAYWSRGKSKNDGQ